MGQENFLVEALRGAYRVFWEKGYSVDFITPELVKNGYADRYGAIYMPFLAVIDEELSSGLEKYVKQGGILYGTPRCGMLGTRGWYNHNIPCFDLSEVFGVKVRETYANTNPNVTFNQKNYSGHWHKEVLDLVGKKTQVIARFNDDRPAVTLNSYGKGYGVFFATHPDIAYLKCKSYLLWDLIDYILIPKEIIPRLILDYTNRRIKKIDGHYLENKNDGYVIITNYVTKNHEGFFENREKTVRLSLKTDRNYCSATDLITGKTYKLTGGSGRINLEVAVKKNEVIILKLCQ